jgi:transcriptional regulator with XRE-family HTH domain
MAHQLNIQNLREAAASFGDDTNTAIAKRAGLGEATISRLFNGTCQPRAATLNRLLMAYRLTIGQLMTDDSERDADDGLQVAA